MMFDLKRRAVAEFLGTFFLLAAVIGSGVMGERLAGGNVAIALLANAIATGGVLVAIISTFGKISGAHFNPAVSLSMALMEEMKWRDVPSYLASQLAGAIAGVFAAHLMFGLPFISFSSKARAGAGKFFSEFIATFGLLLIIGACVRLRSATVSFVVASYIAAAYWFTSSTSFANPAVTVARALSDTFAGIRPIDVPAFLAAQLLAVGAVTILLRWIVPAAAEPNE